MNETIYIAQHTNTFSFEEECSMSLVSENKLDNAIINIISARLMRQIVNYPISTKGDTADLGVITKNQMNDIIKDISIIDDFEIKIIVGAYWRLYQDCFNAPYITPEEL